MAINKRKVLEAARKYATKGAKDKALKEYDKLLKLDPRDAKLRLEIGDTRRRWGQIPEAIETYTKVAEQFMKEGFDARAVAVYKQILNLDAESLACYEPLAELYQRMGLSSEATNALQTAADGYHRAGDKTAALGLLRKMAMLDPSNTTSRLKVADLLHQEGLNSEAVLEYEAVVAELLAISDAEGASKVYERLLDVEPERVSTLTGYVRNLIDRGAADRAEPFARRALEADASPAQYELLGEVLRATGRDEELVELYRELAELYRERGDEERTREILQRYVPPAEFGNETEPGGYIDESDLPPATDESPSEPAGPDSLHDFDDFGDENTLLDEDLMVDDSQMLGESEMNIITNLDSGDELPIMDSNSGSDANEMTRIIPEDVVAPAQDVDQLFAEASVYLRYGKRDQAVANLETVLEIDPTHRAALEKLGEAYVEIQDTHRAVEVWSRAAKQALEDDEIEAANAIRERISAIDQTAAAELVLEAPIDALAGDPDTEEAPVPDDRMGDASDDVFGESLSDLDTSHSSESDLDEIELGDIDIDVDDASFAAGETHQLDVEPQAEVTASDSPGEESEAMTFDGSVERESNPKQIGEDIEEADFYLEQGLLDEAEVIYLRVLEVAPNHPHALVRMGEVAAQRGEDPSSTGTGSGSEAPVAAIERDVPDEPASMEIGQELTDWGDDLSLTDELEIGPIPDDLAGPEAIDEEELSVADLSVAADPIDASGDDSSDVDADTRDLPEAADELEFLLDEKIEIELDDEIDVDFELGSPDSDVDVAPDSIPLPELSLEGQTGDPSAQPEPMTSSEVASQEPEPELAVTRIDFGDDADEDEDTDARVIDQDTAQGEAELEGDDVGFDLAAEIGQALDEDPNEMSSGNSADTSEDGFAAVFAEFKKGVDEALGEGDYEAHYDLGIAYREMGLLDDAMTEFQAAMGNPTRKLACLHLLGLCSLDAERPEDAIAHLQMALATDDLAAEQVLALRFDLGRGFEQSGDIASAKLEYLAVQAEDPQFGDVGSRLEGLGDPEKPSEDETAYESFDDFFDDSDDDDEPDDADAEPEHYESFEDVIAESEADADDSELAAEPAPEESIDAADAAGARGMEAGVEERAVEFEPESEVDVEFEPEAELALDSAVEPESEPEVELALEPEAEVETVEAEVEAVEAEVETEVAAEVETEVAAEVGPVSEPQVETEPETEPEPEPPKARKKRKISFF